ncbi:MAG: glucose/sorbosone family PQQ-dependent dehydrogenase [Vicinamibacterales bacterium]
MLISWLLLLLTSAAAPSQDSAPGSEQFATRVVTSGLENPWEMLWGPDGRIWVTERTGKRVTRVNAADGTKTVAIAIPDILQKHGQDGLLGMALHPDLLKNTGNDFVYLALTYDADPGPAETRRMKIRRYTYDAQAQTLGSPLDLLENLPAGNDHVSGRLAFGRDQKLYLTLGDGGYNQLSLFCQPIHAQELPTPAEVAAKNWQHYEGKILRVNLDGSVPTDNPMLDGARSHVYTYGHRNAQGLIVAADGKIYASEHGPSVDDELNLIQAGKNYGWPYVAGYKDDQVYQYTNWSASSPAPCSSLTFTEIVAPPSVPHQEESAWIEPNFVPPLRTFFTVGADHDFTKEKFATIAPSGIDLYTVSTGGIPGWAPSVLVTSLTRGTLYRVQLNTAGDAAVGQTREYFKSRDRYRDVLVSADGRTIYLAVDAGNNLDHPGSIIGFTYQASGAN